MAKAVKLAAGYNADDLKSKVKSGPKPKKASPTVSGFGGAMGGPPNAAIKGGKGKGYSK